MENCDISIKYSKFMYNVTYITCIVRGYIKNQGFTNIIIIVVNIIYTEVTYIIYTEVTYIIYTEVTYLVHRYFTVIINNL